MGMVSKDVGKRIDGVSAELHGLSLLCEQLAEELTGIPGPRSQKTKEGQPNNVQRLKAEIAALVKYAEGAVRGNVWLGDILCEVVAKMRQLSAV